MPVAPASLALVAPLAGVVAGLIAGSFLATIAVRWPAGRSVAVGRSRCEGCGETVAAYDLVPLLSFAVLRGRCRQCRAKIDVRLPAMELTCAAIGATALAVEPNARGWAGALFGWVLALLAMLDLDHHWLPDRLTLPLAVAGVCAGAIELPPSLIERTGAALAGGLMLGGLAWIYRRVRGREGIGGGDPKLLAAIGAWVGLRGLPLALLGATLLGLGWCLWMLARGRSLALDDALPLGTLLALAAWPLWLLQPWTWS